MKHFTLAALLFSSCLSFAQQFQPAPGNYYGEHPALQSGNRVVVWEEDFANGIPADWQNSEQNGIALWEYRGTGTTPNNEEGSRGSCIATGSLGATIQSPSWTNGFVIFDSNYWDNPDNPCTPSFFGTGAAPGPHLAYLTTPSIDLSASPNLALIYHQYIRHYQGETRIEMSVNQGPWNTIHTNVLQAGETTSTDMEVFVPLGAIAGSQPDVRLRFVYDALYYFWQLDDIQIIETLDNDLVVRSSAYGAFDILDPNNPTGFEYMEYSQYPNEMPPLLKFSSITANYGALAQTDARLNAQVKNLNSNSSVFTNQSTEGFTIQPGDELELRAGTYQMSGTIAKYEVSYFADQAETENFENDNRDTLQFRITDVVYARDRGPANAIYGATPDFDNIQYEAGNVFLINSPNMTLYSLSIGIGIGTATPSSVYGAIYSFDIQPDFVSTLIGTTESIQVTPEMLNNYGDENLVTLNFPSPIALTSGQAYLVVAGTPDGPNNVYFAMNGAAPDLTAWIKFFPSTYYFLTACPLVRMNFGPFTGIEENTDETTLNLFPNPCNEKVYIDLAPFAKNNVSLQVMDATGKMIINKKIIFNSGEYYALSLGEISSGIYTTHVSDGITTGTSRFIKN